MASCKGLLAELLRSAGCSYARPAAEADHLLCQIQQPCSLMLVRFNWDLARLKSSVFIHMRT